MCVDAWILRAPAKSTRLLFLLLCQAHNKRFTEQARNKTNGIYEAQPK